MDWRIAGYLWLYHWKYKPVDLQLQFSREVKVWKVFSWHSWSYFSKTLEGEVFEILAVDENFSFQWIIKPVLMMMRIILCDIEFKLYTIRLNIVDFPVPLSPISAMRELGANFMLRSLKSDAWLLGYPKVTLRNSIAPALYSKSLAFSESAMLSLERFYIDIGKYCG